MSEEEEKGFVSKIAKYLPTVEGPTYKQPFNSKIKWTIAALLMFLVLSSVPIFGVAKAVYDQYRFYEIVLGSKFGSLMTLGIGPIVTSGIILQLLVGSKIINWDMNDEKYRKKFQTWSKLLGIVFCVIEAAAFVFFGALTVSGGLPVTIFVVMQLIAGGIIVILLDEIVSKWGFGSGISLFIAAGVANQIFIRALSPISSTCIAGDLSTCLPSSQNPPTGLLWQFFLNLFQAKYTNMILSLIPILATIVIFLVVIYIQDMGIEIPLSFSGFRGFGRSWSLKLLYTSNIPVILAASLVATLQVIGRFGLQAGTNGMSCSLLACYDKNNQIVGGIIYYLTSPTSLLSNIISGTVTQSDLIRALTYMIFLSLAATVFSVFWVSTSSMDSASVAEQLEGIGMQIPGYRGDKKTMEGVLNRYIPYLTVIGGLLVGIFAALADFTGAIGTGTGILLTVMIIYNYYEQLSAENLEEAHPIIRSILGE